MIKIIYLLLFISLAGQAKQYYKKLYINRTYENKIYMLNSVYSYHDEKDVYIGFLGIRLQKILKDDSQAMRRFRLYQTSRGAGTCLMIWGLLNLFVKNINFGISDDFKINVLMGLSSVAMGHAIGYKYEYYNLHKSIDIFNENNEKKLQEEQKDNSKKISFYPGVEIKSGSVKAFLNVQF